MLADLFHFVIGLVVVGTTAYLLVLRKKILTSKPVPPPAPESLESDVIIVGGGISAVSAGHHLKSYAPSWSFMMLESRKRIGGTWDLFRYPGIRSDSEMYTLGFNWKLWRKRHGIASGGEILEYLAEAIEEEELQPHFRMEHEVKKALADF